MIQFSNNQLISMSRRYPKLKGKVLKRDSIISQKLVQAWDTEKNADKVLSIYLKEKNNLSDERYWELLRTVWILCGKIDNVPLFRELMTATRPNRYYFSTPEEFKKLRELPGIITVYRAENANDNYGISYTLSLDYAKWYQDTYRKDGITIREVNKKEIFAFIERNNEHEIIIL